MSLRRWLIAAATTLLGGAGEAAADLAEPAVPVVLTVVGDTGTTNRGPMDPAVDRLMEFHGQRFDAAAAFDLEMLEALGMESRSFVLDRLPDAQEVAGPTLKSILEAVDADPASVMIVALDDFAVELEDKAIRRHDWIIGLERNGRPLGSGDYGPAWAVSSPAAGDGQSSPEEFEMWPYQVCLIRVGGD